MSIEQLLGLTTQELAAMTDEQLLASYADVFNLEKKLIETGAKTRPFSAESPEEGEDDSDPATRISTRPRAPKLSSVDKKKAQLETAKKELMELEKISSEISAVSSNDKPIVQ